jgi:hypothetical protein
MIAWPGHGGRCGPGPRPFLSGQRCSAPFRRGRCQIALGREWPTAREGRPRQGRRTITDRPTVRRAFSVLCPPLPFGGARGRAALEICRGSRRPTTLRTCPSEFSFAARVQFPAPQSVEAHAQSKRVCRYLRRCLFAAGSPREKNTFRAYKQVTTSSHQTTLLGRRSRRFYRKRRSPSASPRARSRNWPTFAGGHPERRKRVLHAPPQHGRMPCSPGVILDWMGTTATSCISRVHMAISSREASDRPFLWCAD